MLLLFAAAVVVVLLLVIIIINFYFDLLPLGRFVTHSFASIVLVFS